VYLTRDGIAATIGELGSLAPGSELLMDYMVPSDLRDDAARTYVELVGPVTAARGEPWLTFLSPQELSQLLADGGFHDVVHTGQGDLEPETVAPHRLAAPVQSQPSSPTQAGDVGLTPVRPGPANCLVAAVRGGDADGDGGLLRPARSMASGWTATRPRCAGRPAPMMPERRRPARPPPSSQLDEWRPGGGGEHADVLTAHDEARIRHPLCADGHRTAPPWCGRRRQDR
jgi:hypothetical protein